MTDASTTSTTDQAPSGAEPSPETESVLIPIASVVRIRELLDVIPATDAAIVGQIRALLPALT